MSTIAKSSVRPRQGGVRSRAKADPQEAQSQVEEPTQVRDISDSMPEGLQIALNRASAHGFYVAFIFPWGNFTRVIFRRHPDADENAKLPSAEHLSQRYRDGAPEEAPHD